MLDCKQFYALLRKEGVEFFTGVPDSLLKDFCAFITDHAEPQKHVIAANEGGAVGLAAGYYLATGKLPLVYMQNSGQGNAFNPLLSLCDPEVCGISMLLLVGWRGEPGCSDEPQHRVQGRVTQGLFEAAGIPCVVLSDQDGAVEIDVHAAVCRAVEENRPVALLVRAGTFCSYSGKSLPPSCYSLTREEAIEAVARSLSPETVVVSTTGKASRELYEFRERRGAGHLKDFLCVGGMGHASQIALGVALSKPGRSVCCFDGDGAALMHMGGLPVIAACKPTNYKHVLLNNGAHDSVGGQPTAGFSVDFCAIATASGYARSFRAENQEQLNDALIQFLREPGPSFLEIRIVPGARGDLGRPCISPAQNKQAVMDFLHG